MWFQHDSATSHYPTTIQLLKPNLNMEVFEERVMLIGNQAIKII